MKNFIKTLLSTVIGLVVLLLILLTTYIFVNIQGVIDPLQIGNPNAKNKILIASQGSEFKDNLLKNLVQSLECEDNYLNIVDCTQLDNEKKPDWDAIVIIHSAQVHKMPKEAELFLERSEDLSRVILVSTSGAGDDIIKNFEVDAISTASRISITHKVINWLIPRIERKLLNNV